MKTTFITSNTRIETHAVRWFALGSIVVVLVALMTGCRGGNRPIDPTGEYTLVSIDGKAVPCTVSHEGVSPTIKSGLFSIRTNGACLSRITFSVPQHEDMVREVKASYTLNGADLTMKWEGAGMNMGHVDGKQFTMTNEGMVFSYQK